MYMKNKDCFVLLSSFLLLQLLVVNFVFILLSLNLYLHHIDFLQKLVP